MTALDAREASRAPPPRGLAGLLTRLALGIVGFCVTFPWMVVILAAALTAAAAWFSASRFAIDTDADRLLPSSLPWHQHQQALQDAFPQGNMVAVLDGPTPELVQHAAGALAARLGGHADLVGFVHWPEGSEFLRRNALLYLPPDEAAKAAGGLAAARPLLAVLAADPSLRGVMQALTLGARAVDAGQAPPDALPGPANQLSDTLDDVLAGRFASFSWQALLAGRPPSEAERRAFIQLDPKVDFTAMQPGAAATALVRRTADELRLGPAGRTRLRLTGQVPIDDEQFGTLSRHAALNFGGTVVAVLVILWLALHSGRIILAVFLSLAAGFAVTAAAGLLMAGAFNLISIAFTVLFVGLGADFGIQFSVRYRTERHDLGTMKEALCSAARKAGRPLTLAALGAAVGFFSFLPTAYRGVAELGLIAGVGMIIAFLATITVLPALLTLFHPPGEPERMGFTVLAPVDRFLTRHRTLVVGGTVLAVLAGSPLLRHLQFDFDPMHLQDPAGEAVMTYRELTGTPALGINAASVIVPSVADIGPMAAKLAALPEVESTRSILSLVPADQDRKLAAIRQAATALAPVLTPKAKPPPTDEQVVAALRAAAQALDHLATTKPGAAAAAATRLAGQLTGLADGEPALRDKAADALVVPLEIALDRVRAMLRAAPVTLASIPPEVARDWVAPDGRARIEALPRGDDNATLRRFAGAVLAVAPEAAGTPIGLTQGERTIVWAFIEAGALAVVAIALILWITLRRFGDVLLTLLPLLVAGAATLELMVLMGEPFNFANVIALPLLLGVGVAFKIYYIMAWRDGHTNLLQSTLTRAVLFSALTTATAFGSLWLSDQPGMSSMGKLMALALLCTMCAAVLFQPALMGPPRERKKRPSAG